MLPRAALVTGHRPSENLVALCGRSGASNAVIVIRDSTSGLIKGKVGGACGYQVLRRVHQEQLAVKSELVLVMLIEVGEESFDFSDAEVEAYLPFAGIGRLEIGILGVLYDAGLDECEAVSLCVAIVSEAGVVEVGLVGIEVEQSWHLVAQAKTACDGEIVK